MHPDLLNNTLFLRYYKQWQENPSSVVFAPIAEYLLMYGMVDDAFKVCREGLRQHPKLVSGRLAMSKIHLKRGNWEEAAGELREVLSIVPRNEIAVRLLAEVEALQAEERGRGAAASTRASVSGGAPERDPSSFHAASSWDTVTMADIFASQGHLERAREIYEAVLRQDPTNEAARRGMATLSPSP